MDVASLVLLAALAIAGVPLYREVPAAAKAPRRWAGATVGIALALIVTAGWTAWRAAPLRGWEAEVAVLLVTLATVIAGGPVATAVLKLAESPSAPAGTPSPANPLILRGGAWIGVLERIAIGSTVLLGWPEGVALVLVVKGLGRYPELKTPAAAERFIIGTFASVLWACAAAGVGWALLH